MHNTLSDVILDIVQNSIEAGARNMALSVSEDGVMFSVVLRDDGRGMDAPTLERAFDPFFSEAGKHDRRKVGLGLPFLRQLCEATGGNVELESEKGAGTLLKYVLPLRHVDLPPLGDLPGTLLVLFGHPGDFELVFTRRKGSEEYSVSRKELSEALGGFEDPSSLLLARKFLISLEG